MLTDLRKLDLSYTIIHELDHATFPKSLQWLDLSGTRISKIPQSVSILDKLRKLGLAQLTLTDLPDWLTMLGLPFTRDELSNGIILSDTQVEGLDMSLFDQSQEIISRWFDDNTTWDKSEDERTTYIRNLLRAKGYIANDQTRGGISCGSGEQAGELDLDIRVNSDERLTIFEALNLNGSTKARLDYWNVHLDKLLDNYNSNGCLFLFHVTYLSCAKNNFAKHCDTFERHILSYSPLNFSVCSQYLDNPLIKSNIRYGGFLRTMECTYMCGNYRPTVYHIFVRMGR